MFRGYRARKFREIASSSYSSSTAKYFSKKEARETLQKRPFKMSKQQKLVRALYKYNSGAIYEGDWLGGFRHGFGTMTWPDGA
mmetsp:Transcript_36382/g.26992  ORF Transcript_36382/g.26992 Transcript_36382/m.26992 type:complete len:83 (+) Transcript_36382:303-551(+)